MEALDKLQDANWTKTVDIYIQISFSKIYDIDTVNQRFQAEAFIEAKWHDPSVQSLTTTIDGNKIWKPELYIDNAINDVKEDIWYRVVPDAKQAPMVCEIRKVKGLFWEKLELQNFPLDIQDLSLVVGSKKSGDKVNFILLQPQVNNVNISHTLDNSMWHLHDMLRTNKQTIYREYSFGKREYPAVEMTAQAFRLPGFYYWNAFLPILLITLTSLGPFVIDAKLPQSRLPSTATMLLTSVSFKWVIGRLLPTVSYLTSLDKYSLGSLLIISMQLLYHALIAAFYSSVPEHFIIRLDKLIFLFFLSVVILKQVMLLNWIRTVNTYRKKLISHKAYTSHLSISQDQVESNDNKEDSKKEK